MAENAIPFRKKLLLWLAVTALAELLRERLPTNCPNPVANGRAPTRAINQTIR